jgi:hypothetical protein
MTKTGHRAAAVVACAALAVGATACGGTHGPTSIKAALAQKPPRVPTHDTGISGAEQRDLAPLPRKVRNEIVFSGVRFSTRALAITPIAKPGSFRTIPMADILTGAGERSWGCASTTPQPLLPKQAVAAEAKVAPLTQLLATVPALKTDSVGLLIVKAKTDEIATAVIPLKGKNQGIVSAIFSPSTDGTWHLDWLTAGKVTQCGH